MFPLIRDLIFARWKVYAVAGGVLAIASASAYVAHVWSDRGRQIERLQAEIKTEKAARNALENEIDEIRKAEAVARETLRVREAASARDRAAAQLVENALEKLRSDTRDAADVALPCDDWLRAKLGDRAADCDRAVYGESSTALPARKHR